MKIPILFVTSNKSSKFDPYTEVLFAQLQGDKVFAKLVRTARKEISSITKNRKVISHESIYKRYSGDTALDIVVKVVRPLRSVFQSIEKSDEDSFVLISKPFALELRKHRQRILLEYPFFSDWSNGLTSFLLGDRFKIFDDSSRIQLRVRNDKYYSGNYEDRKDEEGVKILINSKVKKTELKKWIDDNYILIDDFLRKLPSFSYKHPRKYQFERDRLIYYLRHKRRLAFKEIGKLIQDKTKENLSDSALEDGYDDFPLAHPSLTA